MSRNNVIVKSQNSKRDGDGDSPHTLPQGPINQLGGVGIHIKFLTVALVEVAFPRFVVVVMFVLRHSALPLGRAIKGIPLHIIRVH